MGDTCDICEKPILPGTEHHTFHDDNCPNYAVELQEAEPGFLGWVNTVPHINCTCDNVAHPECCPVCNPVRSANEGG